MSDSLIIHLEQPSLCPVITGSEVQVVGWVLVPDAYVSEQVCSDLQLAVVLSQNAALAQSTLNIKGFGGCCVDIALDTSEGVVRRSAIGISGPGRRIVSEEFSHYRCFDFSVTVPIECLIGDPLVATSFQLGVRGEIGQLFGISEIAQCSYIPAMEFQTPRGGLYAPVSRFFTGKFLYIEGWAICTGDALASAHVKLNDWQMGSLLTGIPLPESMNNFPDVMSEPNGFCGIFSRENALRNFGGNENLRGLTLEVTCIFKSGKTHVLTLPGFFWSSEFSSSIRSKQIFGRIESIVQNERAWPAISGWCLDAAGENPELSCSSAEGAISLESENLFIEKARVTRNDLQATLHDMSVGVPSGFSFSFDPALFGRAPGRVVLLAKSKLGEQIALSSWADEFSIARILAAHARKFSLQHWIVHWLRFWCLPRKRKFLPEVKNHQDKKTILFVSHNLSAVEGAPKVLFEIVRATCKSSRYRCLVISAEDGELKKSYEALGVSVLIKPNLRVVGLTTKQYGGVLLDLCRLIVSERVDLVYANVIDSFGAIDAARRCNIPANWLIHESKDPRSALLQLPRELRQFFLVSLQTAHQLVFVADETLQVFRNSVFHDRMRVIENGIDVAAIDSHMARISKQQARDSLKILPEQEVITIIGTTTPRKGQDIFLREMRILSALHPEKKFYFFIVGARPGAYLDSLGALAKSLGLAELVTFVPETPMVAEYFIASDVIVVASREESAPLVSLEAFAYQRPLVSTRVFGLARQIHDRKNALAFDLDHSGSLAAAVSEILHLGPLRNAIVEEAREFVVSNFSLKTSVCKHEELIATSLDLFSKAR